MKNTINIASRYHPNLDDQQAAERKLCRLFASFGLDALAERERLIDPFIMRAVQFWRGHNGLDFASLAVEEAEFDLRAWFTGIFSADEKHGRASLMRGRAAFLMCDGPNRFSQAFLASVDDLPADFVGAMQDHAPLAVPPTDDGDMHHQPYEAWSLRHVVAKAMPIDKGMMQAFSDFIRREGRSIGWRNTGTTP